MDNWKKTRIGLLPLEWGVNKIEDCCHILNNQRKPLSSSVRSKMKGEYPYCGANGIVDYINDYKFDGTYVLLAEDGGNFHEYNTKPITYMMKGKFWANNHAHILQAKNGNHYFLHYNLVHRDITKYIIGSTRTKLNKSALESIELPIPPYQEQKKIADILSTVDEKIAVIDQQITATEELKKGLMQRLLTKGIGHTEFKDSPLGKIPKSWDAVSMESIANITSSKRVHKKDYVEKGVPFYRGKEITTLSKGEKLNDLVYIKEDKFKQLKDKYGAPQYGDILITSVGTIGSIYMVEKIDEFYFKDGNLMWLNNITDRLNSRFLLYFLKSNVFQGMINNTSSGSSQSALTIVKFKKLFITVPSISEQKEIAEILRSVDKKLQTQKDKRYAYQQLKKALMQQLLTGKIRVNNLIEA